MHAKRSIELNKRIHSRRTPMGINYNSIHFFLHKMLSDRKKNLITKCNLLWNGVELQTTSWNSISFSSFYLRSDAFSFANKFSYHSFVTNDLGNTNCIHKTAFVRWLFFSVYCRRHHHHQYRSHVIVNLHFFSHVQTLLPVWKLQA